MYGPLGPSNTKTDRVIRGHEKKDTSVIACVDELIDQPVGDELLGGGNATLL